MVRGGNLRLFQYIKKTAMACKEHPWMLAIAALLDALFVFFLAFFTTPVSDRIGEQTLNIAAKAAPLITEGKTGLLNQIFTESFRPMTGKLLLLILLYFIIIYIIYSLFQGITWWMALKTSGRKKPFLKYYLNFAKINITWLGFFVLGMIIYTLVELRYVLIENFAPGTPNIAGNMMLILFGIMAIAAFFSYPNMNRKQVFVMPLKTTVIAVAVSIAALWAARTLLNMLAKLLMWQIGIAGIQVNGVALLLSLVFFLFLNAVKVYLTKVIANVNS